MTGGFGLNDQTAWNRKGSHAFFPAASIPDRKQPVLINFHSSLSGQSIVLDGASLPVTESVDPSISGFDAPDLMVAGKNLIGKLFRVGDVDAFSRAR